eukprot:Polyplicarium_translucidae@DN3145_c0_g1_i2.p1
MTPIPPPLDLAGVGLQGAPGSARLSPLLSQRGQPVPLWAPAGAAVSPSVPPRPPAPLGQKTLTVLCIAAGALMAIVAALGCFNVFQLVTSPFVYILNAFEVAFGVLTVLLEVNPWGYLSAHLRLMTTPVGKGLFYAFAGTVGSSMWAANAALGTVGAALLALGCATLYAAAATKTERDPEPGDRAGELPLPTARFPGSPLAPVSSPMASPVIRLQNPVAVQYTTLTVLSAREGVPRN